MPCFSPNFFYPPATPGGRYVGSPQRSYAGAKPVEVSCGKCTGCLIGRVSEWKVRMLVEGRYHESAYFLTVTYSDEFLPDDFSVSKREAQLFMKRLRKAYGSCRFFLVGEYGDKKGRPHYHAIAWGISVVDLVQIEPGQSGLPQWQSAKLEAVWGKGRVTVGQVTAASVSYVAGYVHKKLSRKTDEAAYERQHPLTGELCQLRREFALMSTRPAIGRRWAEEFRNSDLRHDDVRVDGKPRAMPRYFRKLRQQFLCDDGGDNAALIDGLKRKRNALEFRRDHAADFTPARLAVREELAILRGRDLARGEGQGHD